MVGCDGLYQFPDLLQSASQQLKPPFTVNTISEPVSDVLSSNSTSVFVNRVTNPSHVNTVSSSDVSFAIWHSRLGHPNAGVMKIVSQLCNLPIINKTGSDFCSHCCIGESHIPSSPSLTVYSSPFELIQNDLWGPSPISSSSGYRYYVTFVDAHTQFSWLYLLKSKSDTPSIFKQFQTMVKTQFNLPIKAV